MNEEEIPKCGARHPSGRGCDLPVGHEGQHKVVVQFGGDRMIHTFLYDSYDYPAYCEGWRGNA